MEISNQMIPTPVLLHTSTATYALAAEQSAALKNRLAHVFDLREHYGKKRRETEDFIRQCFATAYAARVEHFMPRLLSLSTKRGDPIAAVGLCPASRGGLFLERYLDAPIEVILQSKLRNIVRRADIIEVGNLSALYAGAARWLIMALTAMLHDEGYKWVTFTGTSALRNSFSRLGLMPVKLGIATAEHLSATERNHWGSYYDHSPIVMAGDISDGYRSLLKYRNLFQVLRSGMDLVNAV